ncbi:hypothetical protein M3I54_38800 [Paraburkholderia sp. CNPSo 3274]|uniref:hypothetical protein n=1 Tax=Paraburkholderia sp. CNPSo 3274 TaxID=2940932 RepID=UPI0020B84E5B|nr:hypothetical protein [Paraburkholderia sp. CNPSo 3274]MCP3712788.1 hypothetical protein [Paraburkholderia sp. CNPSo 3274]
MLLKRWALSEPRIAADFILFDEAQDSDGVMLSVLGRQRHAKLFHDFSCDLSEQCQLIMTVNDLDQAMTNALSTTRRICSARGCSGIRIDGCTIALIRNHNNAARPGPSRAN